MSETLATPTDQEVRASTTIDPEIFAQYREDSKDVKHEEDIMLRQKYGIIAPVLTLSESNLIRREARLGTR